MMGLAEGSLAPSPNAVKHFLGSYRRQTVVNREGGTFDHALASVATTCLP